jgi:hypothetical protein
MIPKVIIRRSKSQTAPIFHPENGVSKQGVCHNVTLPFTSKSICRQKKNYENSNISPCKSLILKNSSKRNQNPSRYYNSLTNLKFQHKPKYHLSKILVSK